MEIIQRKKCILSDSDNIEHVFTFEKFPIRITSTDSLDQSTDQFEDMVWGSSSLGQIQLINLLDPDIIYSNYHSTGVIGKIWTEHHKKFFNFINLEPNSKILEIGEGSGKLAEHFCETDKNFEYEIIEPSNKSTISDSRFKFTQGFFENYKFDKKFNIIAHSHCIEHTYDPIKFLNKINDLLNYGDYQYISIPNMKYGLENNSANTLSFEHTFYIDDNVLEYLLNKTDFKIEHKIIEEHSIFVKAVKEKIKKPVKPDFSYIKELFVKYVDNLHNEVSEISNKIKDKKFYLFGAHMFSLVLLNLGLESNLLECILDNDKQKQNKRMYGTKFLIKSPECLVNLESPIVVLRGGVYTEEIKQTILKINSTTVFV